MAYYKITEQHGRRLSAVKNSSYQSPDIPPLLPRRDVELARLCTPTIHQLCKRVPLGIISHEAFITSMLKSRLNRLNPFLPNLHSQTIGDNPTFTIGWEYLDLSSNGKCLAACSTLNCNSRHTATIVESQGVHFDNVFSMQERSRRETERLQNKPADKNGYNVMGINFSLFDNSNSRKVQDARVVEMIRAPFDTDVTSILSVLAHGFYCKNPSTVELKPIIGFNKPPEETDNQIGSDLYSRSWKMDEPSWSGAFDSRNLKIAVGQDCGSCLIDVMTGEKTFLPSNRKTVISQAFSSDSNLLFCGREKDDVGIIDLRGHREITNILPGSKSAGFVSSLKTDPNHVVTETFSGAINKWDLRTLKPTIVFEGHSNHHNKVPCHIDNKERFLFAVDDGGATRGWSLDDGSLLCTIPILNSPENCSFFPRMVYSDNWGGREGNSGLMLAHNKSFYMYDLFP